MIKVFDFNIANTLSNLGFNYAIETTNNQKIYVFLPNKDLIDYLSKYYTKKDFFIENILRF